MESEHAGPYSHQDVPADSQPIDQACKNDIVDFKKKMSKMREYFLYGVDLQRIEDPDLAEFDTSLRDFHRKIDEWKHNRYKLDEVLDTPGDVETKMQEADKMIFRARSLLRIKKRSEKEDNELFDKYKLLGVKADEIMGKISLEIEEV